MSQTKLSLGPKAGARVVIAGGCGGIGLVLTRQCITEGYEVIVLDIQESIDSVETLPEVTYVVADGREEASIVAATKVVGNQVDGLETLFFLSGFPIIPRRPLAEVSLSTWNELMSVNLTSAYLLVNELAPLLRKGVAPSIVTVASSLAYQVMPGMSAYAASKGGLVTLTKAFAAELAPHVRANVVAPGAVDTDFLAGGTGRAEDMSARSWFDDMADTYKAMIPLGRVAEPMDVVGPMLFLAGTAADYMSGQVLHLNGGRMTP